MSLLNRNNPVKGEYCTKPVLADPCLAPTTRLVEFLANEELFDLKIRVKAKAKPYLHFHWLQCTQWTSKAYFSSRRALERI